MPRMFNKEDLADAAIASASTRRAAVALANATTAGACIEPSKAAARRAITVLSPFTCHPVTCHLVNLVIRRPSSSATPFPCTRRPIDYPRLPCSAESLPRTLGLPHESDGPPEGVLLVILRRRTAGGGGPRAARRRVAQPARAPSRCPCGFRRSSSPTSSSHQQRQGHAGVAAAQVQGMLNTARGQIFLPNRRGGYSHPVCTASTATSVDRRHRCDGRVDRAMLPYWRVALQGAVSPRRFRENTLTPAVFFSIPGPARRRPAACPCRADVDDDVGDEDLPDPHGHRDGCAGRLGTRRRAARGHHAQQYGGAGDEYAFGGPVASWESP